MKKLAAVVALIFATVALAQGVVSYRNLSSDSAKSRVVNKGYELGSFDPGINGTLAVGPLDLSGFTAVEAWIENLGTATTGSCATYGVRDGDDLLADYIDTAGTTTASAWVSYVSTVNKVALGSGFTVAAGATSFAASVGPGAATGYSVQALPRRIAIVCNAATNARPRVTIHAR